MSRLITYIGIVCLLLPVFVVAGSRQCDPSDLGSQNCSSTELCDSTTSSCQCLLGYERKK
ncbi:hypothetical protein NQ317_008166 [Molorchus minor]|uniref:EGF-like domain-containing protein n=1 Tax=Molorchus minor TaxID=1323400 RepID=A0ABQ9JIE3_9CUCU|nr:hypothetical protein NQ317_008166 [Molorchus minor]